VVLSAIAVTGTGAAVAGGVALDGSGETASQAALAASTTSVTTPATGDRTDSVSRSYRRVPVKPVEPVKKPIRRKPAAPRPTASETARARVAPKPAPQHTAAPTATPVPSGDPQEIASGMLSSYGWSSGQLGCLVSLWNRESGWRVDAENPSSGAYGIPQSLPGSKMASAGADWRTDAATQIRWGLGYIHDRYGSPCGAWAHSESTGWY
jgi:hypothetical protein